MMVPTNECRDCRITIPKPVRGDSLQAFRNARSQGRQALTRYLQQYNSAPHGSRCDFKDLPPSVHREFNTDGRALEREARESSL